MKKIIVSAIVVSAVSVIGCTAFFDPCPNQVDCGGGNCAPSGSVCCSETTYCDQGYTCGPGDTCLGGSVNSCLSMGEETCTNYDGVPDCAPLGASCCHNHTYCPSGQVCCSAGCCW